MNIFSSQSSSENYVGVYLFVIVILIGYIYYAYFKSNLVYVISTIDEKPYLVRNLPDKKQAADLLAVTRTKLIELINNFKQHYPTDKRIMLLNKRFKPDEMSESEPNSKYTSYTINKGEKIIYCLRSRDENQKLIEPHVLLFVALHELSHVMTVSVDHSPEFWENFRFVLAHAIHWKIYEPQNFKKNPQPYCGTYITDSPLKTQDIGKYIKYDQHYKEPKEVSFVKV